ncbi:MFS transporter (macronuclear) [Tetrahymena thermophila SB210]|uniref:MFS transporter n=1 Tax=Tetrahymena thermophila (strain SB210) TaxID=312017 RepID=I7LVJ0_TETTS|nr:MFS transporter [Tetrahymena thermophila SB210]EAR98326.1 MFS transporter [Tetrahymena thermophila SB210]|eukprot:XP_001018571.1 MFS transporter [Tetrahymena thermophila SB210]
MSTIIRTDSQLNPLNKDPHTNENVQTENQFVAEEIKPASIQQQSESFKESDTQIEKTEKQQPTQLMIDDVIEKLNTRGIFQFWILFTFCILYTVLCAAMLYPSFYLMDPSFICPGQGDGFTEADTGCDAGCYIDTTSGRRTLTDTLNLYCNNQQLRIMSISILYFGCAIGNIVIGAYSELKGRRLGMIVTWAFSIISFIGVITSYSITQLMIFEFALGFFIQPASTLVFVYMSEVSIGNYRQYFCTIIMVFWSVGELLLPAVAYYEYNWRLGFTYYMVIPAVVVVILLYFFMYESPQFLVSQRRFDETKQVLLRIASWNKRTDQYAIIDKYVEEQRQYAIEEEKKSSFKADQITSIYFHQVFCLPKLLKITAAASGILLAINLIYFGCQLSLSTISPNPYANQVYLGIAEGSTLLFSNLTTTRCKRKLWSFIFHTATCILCLFFLFVETDDGKIAVAFFVRIGNVFAMALVQIYLNELFPTPARAVCQGIVYFFGLVGSIIAPYVIEWAVDIGINQIAWLGIVSFLGSLCCFFLKETYLMPLDQELEESDLKRFKKMNVKKTATAPTEQ